MFNIIAMLTFLYIILFFIISSYLGRLLTPYFLAFIIKRFQSKLKNKFQNTDHSSEKKTYENPKKDKKKKVGEYVDFEELD